VPEDHVWTAEELERLRPDERDQVVRAGTVWDLAELPPEFVARARSTGRSLMEELDLIPTDGP
jgi:hypothetical protein